MAHSKLSWLALAFILLPALATAEPVQFYQKSTRYGAALATRQAANGTDVFIHLEASITYQWAAIGTGDKMDKSFMILMQPSGASLVDVTIRSAHDHDTPEDIEVPVEVLHSGIEDGQMSLDVRFSSSIASTYQAIDTTSSKQGWIWAVGPQSGSQSSGSDSDNERRDGGGAEIQQHSHYGVFFADLTKASQTSDLAPSISGTSNMRVKERPGSYTALVVVHALLLGVAFVIVFPVGVIGLRTRWKLAFAIHWILQVAASAASFIGLALAIALSIVSVEYNSFDEAHQVLGLVIIALLSAQIFAGIWHHCTYERTGQRSVITYSHMLLGRILIYGGMVNAILGALLADDNVIAYVVAAVSFVLACILEYMSFSQRKRPVPKQNLSMHPSSSDVPLHLRSYDES